MDTAQQFLRQQEVQVPEKFVVAGASKISQLRLLKLMSFACF